MLGSRKTFIETWNKLTNRYNQLIEVFTLTSDECTEFRKIEMDLNQLLKEDADYFGFSDLQIGALIESDRMLKPNGFYIVKVTERAVNLYLWSRSAEDLEADLTDRDRKLGRLVVPSFVDTQSGAEYVKFNGQLIEI